MPLDQNHTDPNSVFDLPKFELSVDPEAKSKKENLVTDALSMPKFGAIKAESKAPTLEPTIKPTGLMSDFSISTPPKHDYLDVWSDEEEKHPFYVDAPEEEPIEPVIDTYKDPYDLWGGTTKEKHPFYVDTSKPKQPYEKRYDRISELETRVNKIAESVSPEVYEELDSSVSKFSEKKKLFEQSESNLNAIVKEATEFSGDVNSSEYAELVTKYNDTYANH